MVWQHSLWNVDKGITGWDSAFGAHFSLCQCKMPRWMYKNKVLKQFWESIKVAHIDNKQLWQQLSGAAFAGLGNFRAHIKGKRRKKREQKKKKTGQPREGKSRKMRGSNKLPKRGMEVRTSEREGRIEGGKEGGVKKRKATPLSLYYPSVTGLLGSCYGYRDSRLSVLLTIAHKGSIQL